MTKLKYPSNGLHKLISADLESASKYLVNSIGMSNFIIPEDYVHRKYLLDLSGLLNDCLEDSKDIITQVIKTTKELETLDSELNDKAKKIDTKIIKDLDRMIF